MEFQGSIIFVEFDDYYDFSHIQLDRDFLIYEYHGYHHQLWSTPRSIFSPIDVLQSCAAHAFMFSGLQLYLIQEFGLPHDTLRFPLHHICV